MSTPELVETRRTVEEYHDGVIQAIEKLLAEGMEIIVVRHLVETKYLISALEVINQMEDV